MGKGEEGSKINWDGPYLFVEYLKSLWVYCHIWIASSVKGFWLGRNLFWVVVVVVTLLSLRYDSFHIKLTDKCAQLPFCRVAGKLPL